MTWQELYAKCDELRAGGQVADAAQLCLDTLRARPTFAPALNYLGWLEVMTGNAESGIRHLQSALFYDREYGDAMFNLALGFTELRRFDDAIRTFRRALKAKLLTDPASTWWNLSRLYEQRGWLGQALRCAVQASAAQQRPPFDEAIARLRAAGVEAATRPELFIEADVHALVEQGRGREALDLIPSLGLDPEAALLLRAGAAERAGALLPLGQEADAFYDLADDALLQHASGATSGAEGRGRMHEVEELRKRRFLRYR